MIPLAIEILGPGQHTVDPLVTTENSFHISLVPICCSDPALRWAVALKCPSGSCHPVVGKPRGQPWRRARGWHWSLRSPPLSRKFSPVRHPLWSTVVALASMLSPLVVVLIVPPLLLYPIGCFPFLCPIFPHYKNPGPYHFPCLLSLDLQLIKPAGIHTKDPSSFFTSGTLQDLYYLECIFSLEKGSGTSPSAATLLVSDACRKDAGSLFKGNSVKASPILQ